MSKISIVIPTYNAAHFVCRAVDSALAQTCQEIEIIVVDDGSTDNTPEVLESRYQGQIHYIRQEHRERSAARNNGIKLATGKYIAFLDADDWWLPQKLAKQIEVFESNPDVGLVYCLAARYNRDNEWLESTVPPSSAGTTNGLWAFEELAMGHCFPLPTVVVRRDCLEQVGLFDESLSQFEDWDLWLRLSLKYQFKCVPEVLVGWLARGKFYPYAFADHHALNVRLQIVERVFRTSKADAEIQVRARAQALWFTSLIYLALGQESDAQLRLAEAAQLRQALYPKPDVAWLNDLVSLAMYLFDTQAPEWMALAYIRYVFSNLPAGLTDFIRLEKKALGMLWSGFAFNYCQRGDPISAQRCMRAAVCTYWPLVSNPGVLSIAARGTLLDKLRPFAKKFYRFWVNHPDKIRVA